MLDFSPRSDAPSLRLLILHDDAEGEFAHTSGAERHSSAVSDTDGSWSA